MWPTIKAIRALGGSGSIDEIVEKVVELEGFTEEQQAVLQLAGHVWVDGGYAGQVRQGRATDLAPGDRDRRLVRDYETLPETHEAMVWAAGVWTLSRRLAR
jgi:hypothetical protein